VESTESRENQFALFHTNNVLKIQIGDFAKTEAVAKGDILRVASLAKIHSRKTKKISNLRRPSDAI
jgi:hypothetical protein